LIEGQYRPSTVRIVDTLDEQRVLEEALEEQKPPVPEPCRHLDYQLWSPFRYGRYPRASRFRRAGRTPGVWYGAEEELTAAVEAMWGTLRFFAASPGTPLPSLPLERTAVQAEIVATRAVDLTVPPLDGQGRWQDPDDYADCLTLADAVRAEDGDVIRYASVRLAGGRNVAVLDCRAFGRPAPIASQTWRAMLTPTIVRLHNETLRQDHMFRVGETGLIPAE
jgi:RES domain